MNGSRYMTILEIDAESFSKYCVKDLCPGAQVQNTFRLRDKTIKRTTLNIFFGNLVLEK